MVERIQKGKNLELTGEAEIREVKYLAGSEVGKAMLIYSRH